MTQLTNPHLLRETAVMPSQHVSLLNSHTQVLFHQPPPWLRYRNTAPRLNIHTLCNVRKQDAREKLDMELLQALACMLNRSTVEIQGISAQANPA